MSPFSTIKVACRASVFLCASAPSIALAATYTCTGSVATGQAARSVLVEIDEAAESVTVPTRRGTARGMLQTTMDLYVSRLETSEGRAYLFTLHRYTGRATVQVELPTEKADRQAEFTGLCVYK